MMRGAPVDPVRASLPPLPPPAARPARAWRRMLDEPGTIHLVAVAVAHVAIALLLRSAPIVGLAHGGIVLLYGLWAALRGRPVHALGTMAYIAGAEVLWRMNGVQLPWEFAKYSAILLSGVGLFALGRAARLRALPVVYVLALLPSTLVTLDGWSLGLDEALEMLSFNLSGPAALGFTAWYASNAKLGARELRVVLLCCIGPLVGVGALAADTTFATADLTFTNESNLVTSGGFGPNQVSSALGMGVLFVLILAVLHSGSVVGLVVMLTVAMALAAQGALTLSRGGLYAAGIGVAMALPLWLRDRRLRERAVPLLFGAALAGALLIVPRLDEFTGGSLSARFANTEPTRRDALVKDDLSLFLENPILGVGPGNARNLRTSAESGMTHTEYSRVVAEHGVFGLLSLAALGLSALGIVLRRGPVATRGARIALLAWGAASLLHAAMRLHAFGFAIALAHAAFADDEVPQRDEGRGRGSVTPIPPPRPWSPGVHGR